MYTVEKIKANEAISYPICAMRDCWAVVNENGEIHDLIHTPGHKLYGDVFDHKATAQKMADYLNAKGG